jgi:ribosome-associated protein
MRNALEIALCAAKAADGKKAFDILILDLRCLTSITDYFVICSGSSTTQVGAVTDGIAGALARCNVHPSHIEGEAEARWILMDYGDVVVHIFDEETRAYYGLERLWGDAPRIPVVMDVPVLQSVSS